MKLIPITEEEHVALITDAPVQTAVMCAFGAGGVALIDSPDNRWAMERLAEMRVPDVSEPSPDWLASVGQPVTTEGREAAVQFLFDEGYDREQAAMVIAVVAREVEHDQPARAIEYLRTFTERRNETLVIMTLAHLCAPAGTRKALNT